MLLRVSVRVAAHTWVRVWSWQLDVGEREADERKSWWALVSGSCPGDDWSKGLRVSVNASASGLSGSGRDGSTTV